MPSPPYLTTSDSSTPHAPEYTPTPATLAWPSCMLQLCIATHRFVKSIPARRAPSVPSGKVLTSRENAAVGVYSCSNLLRIQPRDALVEWLTRIPAIHTVARQGKDLLEFGLKPDANLNIEPKASQDEDGA
ncbi:hypothetical protein L1887_40497 [Cichorium endivia]|nr:hypothetical protein L1887_40497 [Cichorium endivia]